MGHGGHNGLRGQYISIQKNGTNRYLARENSHQKSSKKQHGLSGKPGKPGSGGKYGKTAIQGFYTRDGCSFVILLVCLFRSAVVSDGFYSQYEHMKENNTYAPDGIISYEENFIGIEEPKSNSLNLDELKPEYTNLIKNISSSAYYLFKNNHEFIKSLINTIDFISPELSNLIDRLQSLSQESIKYGQFINNKQLHSRLIDFKQEIKDYEFYITRLQSIDFEAYISKK